MISLREKRQCLRHLLSLESSTWHLEKAQQSDSNCIAIGKINKHNHCVCILVIPFFSYTLSPDQDPGATKMHLAWLLTLEVTI